MTVPVVPPGGTVTVTFQVTAAVPDTVLPTATVTAKVGYRWHQIVPDSARGSATAVTGTAVEAPYRTFSSAGDAPAVFAQKGDQLCVSGAGADLWTDNDDYTTIYRPGSVGSAATVQTRVESRTGLTGFGKVGLLVRDDMTAPGAGGSSRTRRKPRPTSSPAPAPPCVSTAPVPAVPVTVSGRGLHSRPCTRVPFAPVSWPSLPPGPSSQAAAEPSPHHPAPE